MNLKTTIVLLLLAGGCVVLFWKGPELAPKVGLAPPSPQATDVGTVTELTALKPESFSQVEIRVGDRPPLTLTVNEKQKTLELPGNWPPRRDVVGDLFGLLTSLKSRFRPIPITPGQDLKAFGLDESQKPVKVILKQGNTERVLTFGEEPAKAGENPFIRPAFVRVGDRNEVLRLGPDVMPILRRDEDAYRRRQLYPEGVERVKVLGKASGPESNQPASSPTVSILGDKVRRIDVTTPSGHYALERVGPTPKPAPPADRPNADPQVAPDQLAGAWVVLEPYRDRVDPAKLSAILTAVPELIVEQFNDKNTPWLKTGLTERSLDDVLTAFSLATPDPLAGAANAVSAAFALAVYERKQPPMTLKLTMADGSTREVVVGGVSRSNTRVEQQPPMFPGQPPQPRIINEDFRYARVGDNPIVFELKDEKLGDLFLTKAAGGNAIASLRDPSVLRFDPARVDRIEIAYSAPDASGKDAARTLELQKTKGNPKAENPDDRKDKWEMVQPVKDPVDTTLVTELLDGLKGMEATGGDLIDRSLVATALGGAATTDLAALGLTPDKAKKITLHADGKSFTLLAGNRDETKRFVMVPGWEQRVNRVNDPNDSNNRSRLDRQPSAYREMKLFDRDANVSEVVAERGPADGRTAATFAIDRTAGGPKWSVSAPFKADADPALLPNFTQFSSPKLVFDAKTDAPLKFTPWPKELTDLGVTAPAGDDLLGLNHPALTLTLKFVAPKDGKAPADVVLEVGKPQSKTEYYARVKGKSEVFTVPAALVEAFDQPAERLVDKTLIQFSDARAEVQSIRRQMNGQELEFTVNNGGQWQMTKPAAGNVDQAMLEDLAKQLTNLKAVRIEAVSPTDLKKYGLEPPAATVTVEVLDKRGKLAEKTLLVGGPVEAGAPNGERFGQVQGSPIVAVLPGPLSQRLTADPLKFRDMNLGGFVTADKFVIERPDRKVTFTKGPGGWKLTEPVAADAEDEDLRELHDALARLRAEELVEDAPKDLSKYGLDKPVHWKVYNGDREVLHLLVGGKEKVGPDKKTDGFRAYAMTDKGKTVSLLDPLLSTRLLAEYRKRDVWDPTPGEKVREISIKGPGEKDAFTLVRGPTGWTDPAKPEDKVDNLLATDLVQALAGLKADRFVADKDADLAKYGLDKPRTVTIKADDGKKRSLLVGTLQDGKRLYAKTDDPKDTAVFILNDLDSAAIDRKRTAYEQKAEQKKVEEKKEAPKKVEPKKDGKEPPPEKK